MSGALTMLLPLLLLGTVTAAICNAGVASNFEGAGSANCCGCCTALTCVCGHLSTNGCHRRLVVHTTALLHRCILPGRPPECCRLQLYSLLPCGLADHICSSLLCILSFAGCLSLSFSFSLCIVVESFVLDYLSNGPFSFNLVLCSRSCSVECEV